MTARSAEQVRAYNAAYHAAHREERRIYDAARNDLRDPEHRRIGARARYARNRPAMLVNAATRRADPDYREAARLYQIEYRRNNQEKIKGLALRRAHGMSLDEYRDLWMAQGGVCAICGRPERRSEAGRVSDLAVDHDHIRRKRRGLLCAECNLALGKFGDDPARLRAAAAYLERHQP